MQGLPSAAGPVPLGLQQPHRRLSHSPGFELPETSVSAPRFCFVAQSLAGLTRRASCRWIDGGGGGGGGVIVGFCLMDWGGTLRNLVYLGMYGGGGGTEMSNIREAEL